MQDVLIHVVLHFRLIVSTGREEKRVGIVRGHFAAGATRNRAGK